MKDDLCREEGRLSALVKQYDMLPPGTRVLCAVSGGADSVYLLRQLCMMQPFWDIQVIAAHYNHNLRGEESRRDENFVRQFVNTHCAPEKTAAFPDGKVVQIPAVALIVGSGDVGAEAARRGTGVEETARSMRYAFLEETAERLGCQRIATAHTADDNAETMLLNLIRGAGLRGLSGIPPVRGKLIRPLLTTQRRTIERVLQQMHIPHVEDSTNADDAYSRNRVRHQLVPLLNQFNPNFLSHTSETASFLRQDDAYLQAIADRAVGEAVRDGETLTLPAAALAGEGDPIATRMARRLLSQLGAWQFGAAHLKAVVDLCRSGDPSAALDLPHGLTARRVYGDLVLCPRAAPSPLADVPLNRDGVTVFGAWLVYCRSAPAHGAPDRDHFFLAPPAGGIVLRSRRTGDGISLPKRGRRTLKKLMIDAKIPKHLRAGVPVLADQGGTLAVAGFGPETSRLARPGELALEITILHSEKREVNCYAGE